MATAKMTTILGKGSVVGGNFTVAGSARIDGTVDGDLTVKGSVVIGASGTVNGNIDATGAVIGGAVNGNVKAPERVELTPTARVIGDITTNVIVIDEKAIFQGKCDMNQEGAKPKKRPALESRKGRKSAKEALEEALKEAEAADTEAEDKPAATTEEDSAEA